jgi:hypothetical protein
MKNLKDYIAEIASNAQEAIVKPQHIMVEQNDGNEALWNSVNDRWSRKAKHAMNLPAKESVDRDWEKGEIAIYEGERVEISIPNGPNSSVGIIIEGRTKMVRESKLVKLEEGVMGGMTPLNPINRMMQLAGISSPTIVEPTVSENDESASADEEIISEADMFSGLFNKHFLGDFKNNAIAARVATIGDIMVGLESQIRELNGKIPPDLYSKVETAAGIGMLLKKEAEKMKTANPPSE